MNDTLFSRAGMIICFLTTIAVAAAPMFGSEEPAHGDHHEKAMAAHAPSHGHHKNHISFFVGVTSEDHHDDETTFGVDYERKIGKGRVGFGGLVDYAGGDLETTVVAPALFVHPVRHLTLIFAPGFEIHDGESEFLVRAGLALTFDVGKMSIGPSYSVDFVDGEEIEVYGIQLGFGF